MEEKTYLSREHILSSLLYKKCSCGFRIQTGTTRSDAVKLNSQGIHVISALVVFSHLSVFPAPYGN